MEKAKQNNQERTMAPASRRAGKKEGEMRLEGSKAMEKEGNKKWNEGQHCSDGLLLMPEKLKVCMYAVVAGFGDNAFGRSPGNP
jgi:hypothetical protein